MAHPVGDVGDRAVVPGEKAVHVVAEVLLDEREGDVDPGELSRAFNRKSVWKRIAIVAAGPIANLALCVLLLWAMFVVGRPDYMPVAGAVAE